MSLSKGHRRTFNTLTRAFRAGDAALLECQQSASGEEVAVVCAVNRLPDGQSEFIPLATMVPGNPYEALNPPDPAGGFYPQEANIHV
jgi:hypothetical protein